MPWGAACLAVDVLMLATAALTADLAGPTAGVARAPVAWVTAFPILVLVFLAARGAYLPVLRLQILDDLRTVVAATAVAAMSVVTLRVLVNDDPWAAAQTVREWVFASVYLGAGRTGLFWAQRRARRRGEAARRTLIVGAGNVGWLTARRLFEQPELGLRPIGFLDKEPLRGAPDDVDLPVLGASWDLSRVIEDEEVEHVIITFSTAPHQVLLEIVRQCELRGIGVSLVPRLFEKWTDRLTVERLGGLPLVSIRWANPRGWQFAVKYAIDRAVAAASIVLAFPILGGAALATLASLGRPVLYQQTRVGRDGKTFEILKLRTMRPAPAEQLQGGLALVATDTAPGGVEGDEDRRTRIGSFLRRTSIDELPQLLNVLKGDMSLVGPRPERPEYADLFEQHVHRYGERQRVKSGITGWAQVHDLRGQTSLADRVEWDNYYIENWSLWLDFKILVMTVSAVLRSQKAE